MNQILKSTISAIGFSLAFLGLTAAEERFDLRVRTSPDSPGTHGDHA